MVSAIERFHCSAMASYTGFACTVVLHDDTIQLDNVRMVELSNDRCLLEELGLLFLLEIVIRLLHCHFHVPQRQPPCSFIHCAEVALPQEPSNAACVVGVWVRVCVWVHAGVWVCVGVWGTHVY